MVKAVIIDDEPLAIKSLQDVLMKEFSSEINIVAVFTNPSDAEYEIKNHAPDVIFLDVDLGMYNGFQFLEKMSPLSFEVIFVTGYNEYAIKAFRYCALDYLLKPIETLVLKDSLARLKDRLELKNQVKANNIQISILLDQMNNANKEKQIVLKNNNETIVVLISNIVYVEASGSYSYVHFRNGQELKRVLMSYSIAEYEDILERHNFFRIHKSYLVNCLLVEKVHKMDNPSLNLKHAENLPISRRRFKDFMAFLKS